jgi:hypothetical protein
VRRQRRPQRRELEATRGQRSGGIHPRPQRQGNAIPATKDNHSTPANPRRHGTSAKPAAKPKLFQLSDVQVAPDQSHCLCPAGKRLYRNGGNCNIGGKRAIKFSGTQRDCSHSPLRAQCLRHLQRTVVRQVAIFLGKHAKASEKTSERMKRKIDSEHGREMIARHFAGVEPVFGNLRYNKGLNRFSLRGRHKVDGQWKLHCLVHNIEKLAHNGHTKQEEKARRDR